MTDATDQDLLQTRFLPDAHATDRLGRALARALGAGDTLLLSGHVGAGKSHLARALIRDALARAGLPQEDIPSPSYTLVQTYTLGDVDILHADLYRLGAPEDAIELGLDEAFGRDLCLVEWPDRLGALAPAEALHLDLAAQGEGRVARLSGPARWATCAAEIAAALDHEETR
jgi:tRNA threonylcarbamoyl adenosine modification protein YjeE